MALKKHRPNTNGTRQRVTIDTTDIVTSVKRIKKLTRRLHSANGRDHTGQISVRHKSAGAKKLYRQIDFKRDNDGVPGFVQSIEYDPNRNTYITLIKFIDGDWRYILAPNGLKVGDKVMAGPEAEIKPGNALPLKFVPNGMVVHNIELKYGHGGQLARSAGTSATIQGKNEGFVTLKLPSGEYRLIDERCKATLGMCSNSDHRNKVIGKAGINRKRGIRPTVRGVAMNAADHPHGGGEGKAPIGRAHPCTPTGKPALGYKTRKNNRNSKYIIRRGR